MFRKIWKSKYCSEILNIIGVFSLTSFLTLGFFLRFIVDILPTCYFTDALIVYVECGDSFIGGFLKFYFQFFSPLILWLLPLTFLGLFASLASFQVTSFLFSLLSLVVFAVSVGASFRIIIKILIGFRRENSSLILKERRKALVFSLMVLAPVIIVLAVKCYMKPPQSSNRMVTVNMWHDELSFPRHYLENWSLIDIPKPEKESEGNPKYLMHSKRKVVPFFNFNIAYNEIDNSFVEKEKIEIRLVPNYNILSKDILFQIRADYLQEKLKKTYRKKSEKYKIEYPVYGPIEQTEDWEIYKSAIKAPSYEPDIYVHRNESGNIENILECTPKRRCLEKSAKNYRICKNIDDCQNCTGTCREESFGTSKYIIDYSFNKKYLNSYFERHQKIISFIEDHRNISSTEE